MNLSYCERIKKDEFVGKSKTIDLLLYIWKQSYGRGKHI